MTKPHIAACVLRFRKNIESRSFISLSIPIQTYNTIRIIVLSGEFRLFVTYIFQTNNYASLFRNRVTTQFPFLPLANIILLRVFIGLRVWLVTQKSFLIFAGINDIKTPELLYR